MEIRMQGENSKTPQEIEISALTQVPKLKFCNAMGSTDITSEYATIIPDTHEVQYCARFDGEFFEAYELQQFPFDRQLLHIEVQQDNQDFKITWVSCPDGCFYSLECDDQEWEVPQLADIPVRKIKSGSLEKLTVVGRVQRRPNFFFWNTVFMIFLIVGISFVSFTFPPDDGGDRLAINITLLLTAVAFKGAVASFLPKVMYLTLIDYYVLSSFLVLIILSVENAVVNSLAIDLSTTVDDICFYIMISIWVIFNFFVFASFLFKFLVYKSWAKVEASQEGFPPQTKGINF
eukprot:TRINITY_DN2798_c0_g1_i2.p1 TRINITY_DN2798_c0_g1~~TRINITY_DN2798_c0_g1_i2.p1  ORF type:complete len:290 (-),score=59.39 TRINITY_DN2798_c0_g1_i2:52-921(-)